jgi:hypothetical protein
MMGCLLINELEILWKEKAMAQFQVLSWHLREGTEENCRRPQREELVFKMKFYLGIS